MASKILKILFLISIFVIGAGASAYLTITLIIKGEETVVVPALKEKEVVYALKILSDLGLNTRIKASRYSETVPVNHVISQEPGPGAEIKKGRNIKLVISRGRLSVSTPHVTGLSLSQALIILEKEGICPGNRSHSTHVELPAGAIIAQSPPPGVSINRQNCMDLLISSGPYRYAFSMTDLTTLPVDDAILKIESANLKLGDISTSATPGMPLHTVVRQTPPAGYRVVPGQEVHLAVNRARPTGAQAPEAARRKVWFYRYRTGAGFLNTHIKIRINSKLLSYTLFDDFVPPNEEIIFLVPRFENITVMLYEDGELTKTLFPGST